MSRTISEEEYQRALDMGLLDDEPEGDFDINQHDILDDLDVERAKKSEQTPAPAAPAVSLDELAAQEAEAEAEAWKSGDPADWQKAIAAKNRRLEAIGYHGAPAVPPAPAPVAPTPELTVDQVRENAIKAEQEGRWMEAMSWKNQLLQRGNR
jgi:hypothetical protein